MTHIRMRSANRFALPIRSVDGWNVRDQLSEPVRVELSRSVARMDREVASGYRSQNLAALSGRNRRSAYIQGWRRSSVGKGGNAVAFILAVGRETLGLETDQVLRRGIDPDPLPSSILELRELRPTLRRISNDSAVGGGMAADFRRQGSPAGKAATPRVHGAGSIRAPARADFVRVADCRQQAEHWNEFFLARRPVHRLPRDGGDPAWICASSRRPPSLAFTHGAPRMQHTQCLAA